MHCSPQSISGPLPHPFPHELKDRKCQPSQAIPTRKLRRCGAVKMRSNACSVLLTNRTKLVEKMAKPLRADQFDQRQNLPEPFATLAKFAVLFVSYEGGKLAACLPHL